MSKIIKAIFTTLILSLFFVRVASAEEGAPKVYRNSFISIVNPIRGEENWHLKNQTPLDWPKYVYQIATPSALPVTSLLRYDAVESATISAFFKSIDGKAGQDLGAFLEVTPKMAALVGERYDSGDVFAANRIFLSGYSPKIREALIDIYMESFFQKFGHYPETVGAWHLDSYSLSYLKEKYAVVTAIICDEQYGTDRYRLWGGYLGSPYFPNKINSLMPADSASNRIGIAITKWAARDLYNFYGPNRESLYSLQVNDYSLLGLDQKYFRNLLGMYHQSSLNEVTHLVIGIENDYSLQLYKEFTRQNYQTLKNSQGAFGFKLTSTSAFGNWLLRTYPESSPAYFYKVEDVTGKKDGTIYWYLSPYYRLGLKSVNGQTTIFDLRLYNQREGEPYYLTKNVHPDLSVEIPALVDSVKDVSSAIVLPWSLEDMSVSYENWKVTFKGDQGAYLEIAPSKIVFAGLATAPLQTGDIKITKSQNREIWLMSSTIPNDSSQIPPIIFLIIGLLICLYFIRKKSQPTPPVVVLVILGLLAVVPLLTVFRSGTIHPFGLGFWGPNGHDAIFHLSIVESLKQNLFSQSNPQYAGSLLKNYHFGSDYLIALISKATGLNSPSIYFQYFPTAITISLLSLVIIFAQQNSFGWLATIVTTALVFLGGSLGNLVRYQKVGDFVGGESVFWANQSVSYLLNPPFAVSLIFLLLFIIYYNTKKPNLLLLILLGGTLAQIKIYAFILLVFCLFVNRDWKRGILVSLTGLVISLPFLSLGGSGGFPFSFEPLWFVRSMFDANDRVGWYRLAQAWQTYEILNNYPKVLFFSVVGTLVFIAGNFAVRSIGFLELLRSNNKQLNLLRYLVVLGIIIPLLVIQKDNPWNSIQFLYYAIFASSLLTGFVIDKIVTRTKYGFLILIFVVPVAFTTSLGTLRDYLSPQSSARISFVENRALAFLKTLPDGTVLAPPQPQKGFRLDDPNPLYNSVTSAYISAYTGKKEYLSDLINLSITGVDYRTRLNEVQKILNTADAVFVRNYFQDHQISYLYLPNPWKLDLDTNKACLNLKYDTQEVKIYTYGCQ